MEYKMLNGLCVPVTTPDNYFELEVIAWNVKQAYIKEVVDGQKVAQELYAAMTIGLVEN